MTRATRGRLPRAAAHTRLRRSLRDAVLFVIACASFGCGPKSTPARRAEERAGPHLEAFARFDRWARRAAQGEAVLRDRAGFAEALFAPIRHDAAILAALVRFDGAPALRLSQPQAIELPALDWIALRDQALGALRVALPEPCPSALERSRDTPPARCVVIERSASAPDRSALTVTLAFADP